MGVAIFLIISFGIVLGWEGMWNLIEIIFTPLVSIILNIKDFFSK